jgi:hypothetical protein
MTQLDNLVNDLMSTLAKYQSNKTQEPIEDSSDRPKPTLSKAFTVHEAARQALAEIAHPAKTGEILTLLRKGGRKRLDYAGVYAALEYRRKHFRDVSRKRGVWSLIEASH